MKKLILAITLLAGFGLQARVGAGMKTVGCRAVNTQLMGATPRDLGTIQCHSGTNYNACCAAHFKSFFDNPSMQKFLTSQAQAFFKDAQYQYVAPVK